MRTYFLTVFKQDGEKLLDETFEAENDGDAKRIGTATLEEHHYEEYTHRCVSPEAKLILLKR